MTKKILAVILALVMALGCVSVLAFADDAEPASTYEKVAAWKANLAPVLELLISNEDSAHWRYVAENNKNLADTMLTYTVFALYDDAWKNGFDKSVSVETAEEVLVSLIEKIDANFGDSKVAEIVKVLQTASDANDFIQKVNNYIQISDVVTSEAWTNTFKYIGYAIKVGNEYEDERERVIEAVARILSVQAANQYYKDFLAYVASVTSYDVVVTACNKLIADIDKSVEEVLDDEVNGALTFTGGRLFETAARIALESNAYTAVALKVYDVGTSVADVLWNTSDQYALMDQLYTTFFVETAAASYAKAADSADLYDFAVNALVALRQGGAETLYNLKLAQNKGLVGMVKNQINFNITINEAAELAFLDLASDILFNTPDADYIKVDSVVQVNTPGNVDMGSTSLTASTPLPVRNEDGYFSVVHNDAAGTFIKTGFVPADTDVRVYSESKPALATAIIYLIENGIIEDYSFTSVTVTAEENVTFNTAFADGYTYALGEETANLNADYVYPAYNEVTAASVTHAVADVVKTEGTKKVVSFKDSIKQFFDGLIAALRNLFRIKK